MVDRTRRRPTTSCSGPFADGHQRGILHSGGAGADRRLSQRQHTIAGGRHAPDGHLLRRDRRRLRRLRRRRAVARLAVRIHRVRHFRNALCAAAGVPACATRRRPSGVEPPAKPSPIRAVAELLGNVSFILLVLYFTLPALAGWVVRDWMPAILKTGIQHRPGAGGRGGDVVLASRRDRRRDCRRLARGSLDATPPTRANLRQRHRHGLDRPGDLRHRHRQRGLAGTGDWRS